MKTWQTSRRRISLERPLVMGILNLTPDSFSDGGEFSSVDDALRRIEQMITEGADIIDIGGESARPGSDAVFVDEELRRTLPVIEAAAKRFDTPISIDTTKSDVARHSVEAGAEIVNDISALRFDPEVAEVAASANAGLVLMHSRGDFESLHSQPPVVDIFAEVQAMLYAAIEIARMHGVAEEQIALDVGIGFGKTVEQNLELIGKLDNIVAEFAAFPIMVGASRKSFIAKVAGDVPASQRLGGSIAAALLAVRNGAKIIRVHDVAATVQALKISSATDT